MGLRRWNIGLLRREDGRSRGRLRELVRRYFYVGGGGHWNAGEAMLHSRFACLRIVAHAVSSRQTPCSMHDNSCSRRT